MYDEYPFRRYFYYDVVRHIPKCSAVFIVGPRKCGKTVCLYQILKDYPNTVFFDAKQKSQEEIDSLIDRIISSIRNNERIIYLIDEVTYFGIPDINIETIGSCFADTPNNNTHLVFTGSQMNAITQWCNITFAGDAYLAHADFIDYREWLEYKGITEVSRESYNAFLNGMHDFYPKFGTLDRYLDACLDETVRSNEKSNTVIRNNDCESLTVEKLLTVLYCSIVSQHQTPGRRDFFDRHQVCKRIVSYMKREGIKLSKDELDKTADLIFNNRIVSVKGLTADELRQALTFLYKCGLVTLTYVSEDCLTKETVINPYTDVSRLYDYTLTTVEDILKHINICVRNPIVYVEIVRAMLGDLYSGKVEGTMLGGIVECHIRSYLPSDKGYQLSTSDGEVDYVNCGSESAVEITVGNKRLNELHFDLLPDGYTHTLIQGVIPEDANRYKGIDVKLYFEYIYDNSPNIHVINFMQDGRLIVRTRDDVLRYCASKRIPEKDFNAPTILARGDGIGNVFEGCLLNYNLSNIKIDYSL